MAAIKSDFAWRTMYPEDTLKQSGPGSPDPRWVAKCDHVEIHVVNPNGDASKAITAIPAIFWGKNLRSHINSTKVAIACHSHIIYIYTTGV